MRKAVPDLSSTAIPAKAMGRQRGQCFFVGGTRVWRFSATRQVQALIGGAAAFAA
ncbi:MAG: hypothetical protein NZ742_07665 [Acidobacteria bacterium]|nr:hypothetical protein [Acidobacteriota bacterium]MDW7984710.1 hypothetical protein [Acidobacteriota bacterium]